MTPISQLREPNDEAWVRPRRANQASLRGASLTTHNTLTDERGRPSNTSNDASTLTETVASLSVIDLRRICVRTDEFAEGLDLFSGHCTISAQGRSCCRRHQPHRRLHWNSAFSRWSYIE